LRDLRSLQDWFIRYQLNAVPGVAEVASVGGSVRQYQIEVDPHRLRAFHIPLSAVVDAVMRSNRNVGGNVVEASGTWSVVRGLGLIASVSDIERIVIGAENGVPIFLRQVAAVQVGDAFRASALVHGTEEAVGGVVVARYGVSTIDVIERVKEKLKAIEAGLPPGVRVVPFYDRAGLIARAVNTLKHALIEETIIVTLVHIVFLMHLRSVLIVTIPLPLAVLAAFLGMRYFGISANIMSLSGIAIAIGVLVDAAIVVTENAFRGIEQRRIDPRDRLAVAPDLFLHGDYPAGIPAGFCAHWPGRQALSSSGLYQDLCRIRGDIAVRHPGAGALHPAARGQDAWRRLQPCATTACLALSPAAALDPAAPYLDAERRGADVCRGGGAGAAYWPGVHAAAQ
jgi:Cu/Ag efflux pump CusA